MTSPKLPPAYVTRMTQLLGKEADEFFAALDQPPLRGLRIHPAKTNLAALRPHVAGIGEPIPWCVDGFYLAADSPAGLHPLHEAGAYYMQEPSAMASAAALRVQPGETVLDLCAAPGGKSTQLAAALLGTGTLVCNEPVPSRAQILSRNVERLGIRNAVVVCADPEQLSQSWPQLFDAILVDAPCSGEGMFRRHPETRLEWDADSPARCAARQKRILESACAMLKPGGRLCYSTCTFSPEENEQNMEWLIKQHPELQPLPFVLPVGQGKVQHAAPCGLRLYPHTIAGEGHFIALFGKTASGLADQSRPATLMAPAQALIAADKQAVSGFQSFWSELSTQAAPIPNASLGDTLLVSPPLPPLRGIRVLRAGCSLGQYKTKRFVPDHAMALAAPGWALPCVPMDANAAAAYLRGEALPSPDGLRGYVMLTFDGLPLGFAKASDGWLKNHYPKGLRKP